MTKPKLRDRPIIPEYGIEETEKGLLEWDWVVQTMNNEWNYWVCTTNPNGSPHATPVWGIWLKNSFYFGGGPNTRKAKNLMDNPQIVIHSETRDNVVIIEGKAIIEENEKITSKVQEEYKLKYNLDHPPPFWSVRIQKVLAWKAHSPSDYQSSPTRWIF